MMTLCCNGEVVYQARIWSNMMRNALYSRFSLGWVPSHWIRSTKFVGLSGMEPGYKVQKLDKYFLGNQVS